MTATAAWEADFAAVVGRIGPRFARAEARRHAADYLRGLLGRAERKNGWQLAEAVGDATPYGLQQFLYRATWDPDAVRDDLRGYVVEQLGDPQGVLVVDETGFLKKGDRSAGVQPQYSGAAGRTANAQIGVFLTYAGPRGHTFLDRALYLPASWTADRDRCRAAGIPDDVACATKPALAQALLERALDAGVPAAWVTPTASTATCNICASGWRRGRSATCWRSPARTRSGAPTGGSGGSGPTAPTRPPTAGSA